MVTSCDSGCSNDFAKNARYRIVVSSQSLVTDSYGGQTNTWTTVGTYWAWIKPLTTYEKVASKQLQASATHKFTIRFQSVLQNIKDTGGYKITFDSRTFNILGIKNLDNDLVNYGNAFQELTAEDNGAEKE